MQCYTNAMSNATDNALTANFNIRVDQDFLDAVEVLRREQSPLPSKAEIVRSLVIDAARAVKAKRKVKT